jgi:two-component system, chemotaxis family, chemotaxis protein CheY
MPSEGKRALIVDDVIVERVHLTAILKGLGYATMDASDGKEGIDLITKQSPFSLIVLDWYMPNMDGIAFLKALHSLTGIGKPKVLMLSGETDLNKLRLALNAGANEFLMKPYTRENIQLKLRMLGLEGK